MLARIILLALTLLTLPGCAAWDSQQWDLTRYRDPRAADIDRRLAERPPVTGNPFSSRQESPE